MAYFSRMKDNKDIQAEKTEDVLKGLRDIVKLAEESIDRMQGTLAKKERGEKIAPMDLFYFFTWYGDCVEVVPEG